MAPEVMQAHGERLLEWANLWEQGAPARHGGGEREVAFQMRRLSQLIGQIKDGSAFDPVSDEALPPKPIVTELRSDEDAGTAL